MTFLTLKITENPKIKNLFGILYVYYTKIYACRILGQLKDLPETIYHFCAKYDDDDDDDEQNSKKISGLNLILIELHFDRP